jgi:site-specific DNA-methyltransferase (adenine-specific)
MAVAIEDAGFEIRDSIHWTYGSGFPKSYNIAKGIEGTLTNGSASWNKWHELNGELGEAKAQGANGLTKLNASQGNRPEQYASHGSLKLQPTTEQAKQWQGWGTALKPSHEPIVLARKPLIGTVAENVLQHSTGGINIDATRIGTDTIQITNGKGFAGSFEGGENNNKNSTHTGRFPANTLLTHNHDCQATGTVTDQPVAGSRTATFGTQDTQSGGDGSGGWSSDPITTTTYTCTPNCPVATLNQQSGNAGAFAPVKSGHSGKSRGIYGDYEQRGDDGATFYSDTGGAARFFHNSQWQPADDITPFIYQAKAGKKERNAGLNTIEPKFAPTMNNGIGGKEHNPDTATKKHNFHPTVKPIELMRYLIKLITPPKGTVLDPFLGSGTTAVAAILEGFDWKGCEMTEDYLPIIKGRVNWALKEKKKEQPKLI